MPYPDQLAAIRARTRIGAARRMSFGRFPPPPSVGICYNDPMIANFADRAAVYLETDQNRNEIHKYIDIYLALMKLLGSGDISANAEFRSLYNVFYKLRFSGGNGRTSGEIYSDYYRLIETHKHDREKPTIEQVLSELWELTGKVHLSFGSKLIGTLYPDSAPIWDNNVRILLDIPYKATVRDDHLALAATAYHALERRYIDFASTPEAFRVERVFDSAFPDGASIAPWKKFDFLLWRMGSRRSRDVV